MREFTYDLSDEPEADNYELPRYQIPLEYRGVEVGQVNADKKGIVSMAIDDALIKQLEDGSARIVTLTQTIPTGDSKGMFAIVKLVIDDSPPRN